MMEGLSSRAYESDTICKGGHELMPGERPRTTYPWKQYASCPQCGSKGMWEQNDSTGHCALCGTWVWRERPVTVVRQLTFYKPRKQNRTVTCCEPKCDVTFKTASLHEKVRCPKCRDRIRKANNSRYRKEARKKLKSTVRSDDATAEVVLNAMVVKSQSKEATT